MVLALSRKEYVLCIDRLLRPPLRCMFPLILTGMHGLDLLLFSLCLPPTLQPHCLLLSSSWIVGFSLSLCLRQSADLVCRQCQWCYMNGFQLSGVVRLEGIKHIPVTEYTSWLYLISFTLCTCHISRRKYNKMCKMIRHGDDTAGCCWHGAST